MEQGDERPAIKRKNERQPIQAWESTSKLAASREYTSKCRGLHRNKSSRRNASVPTTAPRDMETASRQLSAKGARSDFHRWQPAELRYQQSETGYQERAHADEYGPAVAREFEGSHSFKGRFEKEDQWKIT